MSGGMEWIRDEMEREERARQAEQPLKDFPLKQVADILDPTTLSITKCHDSHGTLAEAAQQQAAKELMLRRLRELMAQQAPADKEPKGVAGCDEQQIAPSQPRALRFNDSKVPLQLLPADAEAEEALVWMCGLRKYPPAGRHGDGRNIQNWETLWGEDTLDVALGCAMRHLAEVRKGNFWEVQRDKEGQIMRWPDGRPVVTHHAASVRTNMAMVIRYLEENFAEAKAKFIESIEE